MPTTANLIIYQFTNSHNGLNAGVGGFASLPGEEGYNDAQTVQQGERQHKEDLRYQIGWRQQRRKDCDAKDGVANMLDEKAVIDHADPRQEIGDYRKLKHHPKR
jgi:hypothetical protein